MGIKEMVEVRETKQELMPYHVQATRPGTYNLYPGFPIGEGKIDKGYDSIAKKIAGEPCVVIDGYIGVLWEKFRDKLDATLCERNITSRWINISDFMVSEDQVKQIIEPCLGGDDPVFGTRFTGDLSDFFDEKALLGLTPGADTDLCILYGCGAALAGWKAPLMYVDLPKNELQYRSRAGSITNLGMKTPYDPKAMYKQFYFVDWIVLNKHKSDLIDEVDWIIDEQRHDEPAIMSGNNFRSGLEKMSKNVFRVRPWFEPGVWGGQWCKRHLSQLPKGVPNYAWSFEMIVPENGLLFSSDDKMLEVSFDWLMYKEYNAILGDSAGRFGYEFPIRFDFLDTFDGGNLSLQCHPRPDYIQEHFGELFTQDETYYIMDCKPDAEVYLGFQEDIDPQEFRGALEKGLENGEEVEVDKYVLRHSARKHDLFLIPSGTVHCSGTNNMVLEISATPYIFTFKMYDWQRLDLDGSPRPINIERAFENLQFDRKGQRKIETEFISTPYKLEAGEDWKLMHMPTHPEHFYDIHRYDFINEVKGTTNGSCHVMNLVEGKSIILETANGFRQRFNYAETFAVPAAAGSYRLINEGGQPAKVVKAFLKRKI